VWPPARTETQRRNSRNSRRNGNRCHSVGDKLHRDVLPPLPRFRVLMDSPGSRSDCRRTSATLHRADFLLTR